MDRREFLKTTAFAAAATAIATTPLAACDNSDYPQRESEWQVMNFIR